MKPTEMLEQLDKLGYAVSVNTEGFNSWVVECKWHQDKHDGSGECYPAGFKCSHHSLEKAIEKAYDRRNSATEINNSLIDKTIRALKKKFSK